MSDLSDLARGGLRIYEDLRSLQRRVAALRTVLVCVLVLLAGWFGNLQILRGRRYRELADDNRIRMVRIPAPRGTVFDRSGRVLIENRSSYNIVFSPEHAQDLDRSITGVALLLGIPEAHIRARLAVQGPRFRAVVIKADAPPSDVAAVEARRLEYPEVSVEVVPLRSYPLGAAGAHTLGRVGEITERQLASGGFDALEQGAIVGQAGVEYQYNQDLMGVDGSRHLVVNSRGLEVSQSDLLFPREGPSLNLTIDLPLQTAMEEALRGLAGSAVALDPHTGEVLGLVSNPSYDPNVFSTGIEPAAWATLARDSRTPLINRVVQGQYPAGSTFKMVTALAALQERLITPSTRFHCPGYLRVYNTVFRCHEEKGHGWVDLRWGLVASCNVYFYNVGIRLEIERIAAYAKRLGLGRPTGIDLPHEAAGLIPDPGWKRRAIGAPWFPGETVSVSIGQGQVLVTGMQMARLAAAIANGGRLVQPHLLRPRAGAGPAPADLGLDPAVVQAVREAMVAVVDEGTGWRARLPGVAVAGKTGSAQVVASAQLERRHKPPELQPHGWFVSFAPAREPRVAMAVLVEHGRNGGESAAPVTARILARYFGLSVPPTALMAVVPSSPASPPARVASSAQ